MIVAVIGLGYIGLPTAALIASKGIKVVGVDVNQNVVNTINEGKIHIVEPDLDILVQSSVQSGNLRATTETEKADVFIVAVPTPFQGDHEPDLSYIKSAAKAITPVLEKGNLVILESTSPVGTTEKLMEWMKEERSDLSFPQFCNNSTVDVSVAYCQERVLPGNVVRELVENDRIIGGVTIQSSEKARDFYNIFIKADCLITDSRTAELSKLVENSFRDVNIAFANELSLICDKLNLDDWELIKFANHHPRVNILQPGPGVGGHCIAVDPWFIVDSAPDELASLHRAIKVLRTIVLTAGVTATPDLWLLRQVLGTHCELGTLAYFLEGHEIEVSIYAEKNKLNAIQLSTDLHFLYSRGFLNESAKGFAIKDTPLVLEVFRQIKKIPDGFKVNMVPKMSDWFYGEQAEKKLLKIYCKIY